MDYLQSALNCLDTRLSLSYIRAAKSNPLSIEGYPLHISPVEIQSRILSAFRGRERQRLKWLFTVNILYSLSVVVFPASCVRWNSIVLGCR